MPDSVKATNKKKTFTFHLSSRLKYLSLEEQQVDDVSLQIRRKRSVERFLSKARRAAVSMFTKKLDIEIPRENFNFKMYLVVTDKRVPVEASKKLVSDLYNDGDMFEIQFDEIKTLNKSDENTENPNNKVVEVKENEMQMVVSNSAKRKADQIPLEERSARYRSYFDGSFLKKMKLDQVEKEATEKVKPKPKSRKKKQIAQITEKSTTCFSINKDLAKIFWNGMNEKVRKEFDMEDVMRDQAKQVEVVKCVEAEETSASEMGPAPHRMLNEFDLELVEELATNKDSYGMLSTVDESLNKEEAKCAAELCEAQEAKKNVAGSVILDDSDYVLVEEDGKSTESNYHMGSSVGDCVIKNEEQSSESTAQVSRKRSRANEILTDWLCSIPIEKLDEETARLRILRRKRLLANDEEACNLYAAMLDRDGNTKRASEIRKQKRVSPDKNLPFAWEKIPMAEDVELEEMPGFACV